MLTAPILIRLLTALAPAVAHALSSNAAQTADQAALFQLTLFRFHVTAPEVNGGEQP